MITTITICGEFFMLATKCILISEHHAPIIKRLGLILATPQPRMSGFSPLQRLSPSEFCGDTVPLFTDDAPTNTASAEVISSAGCPPS